MIFETHAHYDDSAFDDDREELLGSMREHGVDKIINVCANLESLDNTERLMKQYPYIYGAFGLHPDEVGGLDAQVLARIEALCREEKAVAVGEIGLDYYWNKENRETQIAGFRSQIALARTVGLPLIIHSREAAADTMMVMKEMHTEEIGGVIHCYSYSVEMARQYLDMGFYLGIGGVVTFKNAKKLVEVVRMAPLSRLLLETDSPYLAPVPNRGKRNTSWNLWDIAAQIASIKEIDTQEVIDVTCQNAMELFLRS